MKMDELLQQGLRNATIKFGKRLTKIRLSGGKNSLLEALVGTIIGLFRG